MTLRKVPESDENTTCTSPCGGKRHLQRSDKHNRKQQRQEASSLRTTVRICCRKPTESLTQRDIRSGIITRYSLNAASLSLLSSLATKHDDILIRVQPKLDFLDRYLYLKLNNPTIIYFLFLISQHLHRYICDEQISVNKTIMWL